MTYEALRVRELGTRENYENCLAVNREQTARLAKAETELTFLRDREGKLEARAREAEAKARDLEPLRSTVAQPAIGRKG